MTYQFNNRDELQRFITDEIMTTPEALEYLGITRQALSSLIQRGKLKPIKEYKTARIFFKTDLEERKKEVKELNKKYQPYD